MKQFILSFSLLLLGVGAVLAGPDRAITREQLPATAQQFLQEYFPKAEVTAAHEDGHIVQREYDVMLDDGTHIQFAADGRWLEVESRGALPRGIVPPSIVTYTAKHYPSLTITRIERSRREWEVGLSNGVEIKFNRRFSVISIDD
ncbi:MAG: PepSY-like domain-containing protein [Alistipes sp.]|nr:PepSY-like domain-containing protein [Alistipes sp.]